jgi:hypothetical protein
LNAARSKMQAAVHVYVNEQIKPKSQRVKVIPDVGNYLIIILPIVPSVYRAVHVPVPALSLTCIAAGQVLLNWLSSGNGPLLLSSRAKAGIWTPEPAEMSCVDALRMTKGVLYHPLCCP